MSNTRAPLLVEDLYPSRNGEPAQMRQRLDPVVYADPNQPSPIDAELVAQYEQQGFVVIENFFDADEIAAFQLELERLRQDPVLQRVPATITEQGSGSVRSIFQIHRCSDRFRHLSEDTRLAGLASYLLGDQVYIHQSRLNYKPGFTGKEFYWHSDFETWHVEDGMPRMRALSMSITLTENFPFNGPLMLIPGSHRRFLVCEGETPENHHQQSLKKQEVGVPSDACLQQLVEESTIVTATGKPGSLVIFDCNVMHGSNGNITPFPRSNLFFVYNAVSNRVSAPFCHQPPRPEFICTRLLMEPIPGTASTPMPRS